MLKFLRKFRLLIILILFISLFFILGVSYGKSHPNSTLSFTSLNIINNTVASTSDPIDMAPFWKVWKTLDEKYIITKNNESSTTTNQDRIWGAIQGMTASLGDPYTVFLPPDDNKDFTTNISGNFEGVGMEIGVKDKGLTVIAPLKESPAEKAGIKAGDKIITINDKAASDLSADSAVKLIRGPKNTIVKIGIYREDVDKTFEFNINRAIIDIPTIKTEIKDDVFIISLYNFYAQSQNQFRNALKEFIYSKKQKLILDLRGNPGGYLDAPIDMASWFLPLGKIIVREEFGDNIKENIYRSKGYNIFNDKLQMIILVDNGSASASEILAGALQYHNIAKLLGTKTYGKGSVQELIKITDNTSLKVTIAKWLTPGGISISEGGLTPDYEIKISENDIKNKIDTQIEKAIEILNK